MTSKIKLRSISPKKFDVYCHEYARPAYVASKGLIHQISSQPWPSEFISMTQLIEPMHVIKVSPSRFLFFAGWQWFDTTSTDHSKEINAIVHDDVSQEKIVNFSWAYVLTKLLSDLHRDSNLYQLVSTIDKMPNEIRKYLFKENYSHSAIKTAMRITNESRSAIRNHMSKNRFQTERSRSILDELLEDG